MTGIYDNPRAVRILGNLFSTIRDRFVPSPTDRQKQLAEVLRADLAESRPGTGQQSPFWEAQWRAIIEHARSGDARFFMRWPPIAATMVNGTTPFSAARFRALRRSAAWRTVWRPAITHPPHGYGPPFFPWLGTNANTVMHAAHVDHFARVTGGDWLSHDVIIEFGGGYGSMCRLVRAMGFRGRYVIFDLPPVLALQKYYLALNDIPSGFEPSSPVLLTSTLPAVRDAIAGTTAIISTWALSEMPLSLRDQIAESMDDERVRSAMFAYQKQFEGIDNRVWFNGLRGRPGWRWIHTPIDASSDYLVAVREPTAGASPRS